MNTELPKEKQTTLGLYVTAKEAYAKWQANPDNVMIIDVRTPEEFMFIGHPTMAWKIPVVAQSYEWDAEKKQYPMQRLPDFVERVKSVAKPNATIMTLCRSGARSAIAANLLAEAGFHNVYNIVDGMEGDTHGDPKLMHQGGWKNSACPWTKKMSPEQTLFPAKA